MRSAISPTGQIAIASDSSSDTTSTIAYDHQLSQTGLMPVLFALVYPAALSVLFNCVTALRGSSTLAPILWAGILVSLALVYSTPIIGLHTAYHASGNSVHHRRLRLISYLAVAAPPLFTTIGVYFDFLMGIANSDYVVWGCLWTAAGAFIVASRRDLIRVTILKPAPTWLRFAHGVSALGIVLIFLAAHLVNHAAGILSGDAHMAVMKILRLIYRNDHVQPLVIALFAVQFVSGGWLLGRLSPEERNWFRTLQAASGTFLAVFIPGHTTAVFVLGRYIMHADTNWKWLTGFPMLGDPWSVRLIPHYSLVVFMATTHLACGLRNVLLEHNVARRTADRLSVAIMLVGAVGAIVIISGMLGVHVLS
jgi:hypothetical protein